MNNSFPKVFAALLVAVLLLCAASVTGTLFHQSAVLEEISQLSANLDAVQGRLRKQQAEYAQALEALPQVLAELDAVQPEADAVYELEQELRQQRKELRAANADLADELAALQLQADESALDTATVQALAELTDVLEALKTNSGLFD